MIAPVAERVRERTSFGIDDMHGGTAEAIGQHPAERMPIVYIQPLRRGNEGAVNTRSRQALGF